MPVDIEEIQGIKLTEADKALFSYFKNRNRGEGAFDDPFEEEPELPTFNEFLATPSAKVLIPRVVIGTARRAMEPLYIGTRFFRRVRMRQAADIVIFPSFGAMRADFVGEGEQYPRSSVSWQKHEGRQIHVRKSGIQVDVTEETIKYSMWDVFAMNLEEAGRAMARHKEQQAFRQFTMHGHTVFDNDLDIEEAHTTGMDEFGNYNGTMSTEDLLDLLIALHANGFTPTNIIMHSLAWPMFAKQALVVGPLTSNPPQPDQPSGSFQLGPGSIQGRIPFAIEVQLSPFVPFDETKKTMDLYAVDRNNVGVLLEQEPLTQEDFNDPQRDIRSIKLRESYGFGVLNEGRAIAVAKNIRLDVTYPRTPVYRVIPIEPQGGGGDVNG